MKIRNKKKSKIFLICLSITLCLMILKKTNYIKRFEETIGIRSLFEQETLNYVCDKAGNSLAKKYSNGYDAKIYETKKPNKAQNAIIDFARDSKSKYIKDYLSRFRIFLAFLILDIIFIFFWISYCCCCCCNCCCFKTASPPSYKLRTIFFLISSIFNLFVIICSIVILYLINPFVKKLNGIGCSTFTLVDHFRDGLGTSYPQITNKWGGIPYIKTLLIDTNNKFNEINYDVELNKSINYAKSNYSNLTNGTYIEKIISKVDFDLLIDDFYELVNSSLISLNFDDVIQNIDKTYDEFTKTEYDACQDVYDILHDHVNKYVKKVISIFFTITLVFGFLGLLFLILYYIAKYNCFRIIYVIIWNISMLLMLFSILISIIFGIIGFLIHDGMRVIQYILSEDNLNNNDPLLIDSNNFISDLIVTCVNGDGEFLRVIQENQEIKNYLDKFNLNLVNYNNIIYQLNQFQSNEKEDIAKKSIINVFELLLIKTADLVNLSSSLVNINCNFARNDEMIVLGEMDSFSKYGVAICALSFLVGILFGLSILAGILFVHRYKYENENSGTSKITEIDNNANDKSDTNINEKP